MKPIVVIFFLTIFSCDKVERPYKHYLYILPSGECLVQLEDNSIKECGEQDMVCQTVSDFKSKEAYIIMLEEKLKACEKQQNGAGQ